MKLECEKFKEFMESEEAECRHPDDYCTTRTSCIIHFLEKDRKRQKERKKTEEEQKKR